MEGGDGLVGWGGPPSEEAAPGLSGRIAAACPRVNTLNRIQSTRQFTFEASDQEILAMAMQAGGLVSATQHGMAVLLSATATATFFAGTHLAEIPISPPGISPWFSLALQGPCVVLHSHRFGEPSTTIRFAQVCLRGRPSGLHRVPAYALSPMTQAQELSWEADGTRFTALHFFDSMTQQEIASITSYRDRQAFIRELCVPSEHVTGPAAQPTRAGAPTSPEAAAVEPRLESGQPAEGLPPPSPLDEFSPAPKRPRTSGPPAYLTKMGRSGEHPFHASTSRLPTFTPSASHQPGTFRLARGLCWPPPSAEGTPPAPEPRIANEAARDKDTTPRVEEAKATPSTAGAGAAGPHATPPTGVLSRN